MIISFHGLKPVAIYPAANLSGSTFSRQFITRPVYARQFMMWQLMRTIAE
jgi:hypothetical protein